MKRFVSLLIIVAMLCSCAAFAESAAAVWLCRMCGTENNGKYCGECGTAAEQTTTWNCSGCGKTALDTAFCPDCGTKRPVVYVRNNSTYEGTGFTSDKEAAAAYVEFLNAADIPGALSTFAVETYMDNLDTAAEVQRMHIVSPVSYRTIPAAGKFSRSLLIEQRHTDIIRDIYYMYLYYSAADSEYSDLADGMPMSISKDDGSIEKYIEYMRTRSAERFAGNMKINAVYRAEEAGASAYIPEVFYFAEANQKRIETFRNVLNADEISNVIVMLEIDGTDYIQFLECARYGDRWYNTSLSSDVTDFIGMNRHLAGLARADIFM